MLDKYSIIKEKKWSDDMNNLFEILPLNFFNIFSSANKSVFSDCIFVLYDYMKDDAAFASLKDNIIFELTQYFNGHIVEFEDIQSHLAKDRAFYVYRRLKDCGWINEEVGENYQIYASFEDYATTIIETLLNLDKEKDIEYSSMVYNIYSAFLNFDVNNGHKILDAQYNMTKDLMTKLKNLNTNIKRYIKKLLKDNMKNNLNDILDSLLSEYQMKIVDRAFYNLTTKDNPLKYRNSIISQIQEIRVDEMCSDTIIRNIMVSKDIDYQEAYDRFDQQTLYMIDAFEGILDLINEISRKNEKFVASATNRIMFLINVKEDIGGKINEVIKEGQKCSHLFEDITNISINKFLDLDSLYTPRQMKRVMETQFIVDPMLDEEIKKEAIRKLRLNEKYTRSSIEKNVLEKLKDLDEILGSQYYEYQDDLSLFILTWLYGYSQNSQYTIEPLDQIVTKDQYQFREFIIRGVK